MSDELDVYFDKLIKACRKPKCCVIDINCCIKDSSFIEKALKNKDFLNKKRKYLTEATNPKQKDEEYIHKIKDLLLRKGYKYKDTYIDEPNLITDLDDVLDNMFYRTCSYNNPKLLIAGSSTVQGEKLKNLSADTSYSRHVINIEKYTTNKQLEELKNMMTTEQFATEIQCKFV